MRFLLKTFFLFFIFNSFSQESGNSTAVDSLYREDQFYIGITYNALQNLPIGVSQKKFTPSFNFGFLRDMPINKTRTIAIAAGFGYSINNYNENLFITENNGIANYYVLEDNDFYDKNKLVLHYIDLPIEFRWRTSTPQTHKFYRVYAGLKVSYLIYNYTKYVDDNNEIFVYNNLDLDKWQYGVFLNFGYNTWNFHCYYGLNPIFKTGMINNKPLEMKSLNFGLSFYIL